MKTALLISFVLFTAGCHKTGFDTVDDFSDPHKTCGMNITLQNLSSKDLRLSAWGTQSADSADCKQSTTGGKDAKVPAGQTGVVELNMECKSCDIHPVTAVRSDDGKSTQLFAGNSNYKIICTDTECKGEN